MRRVVKYILAVLAIFICVAIALFEYSSYEDQKTFSAAANQCERACIHDSGGIDQCRKFCTQHPDHYP